MLLQRATVRNLSRALREIKAFEWEGKSKPMAREALREILERGIDWPHSIISRPAQLASACLRQRRAARL